MWVLVLQATAGLYKYSTISTKCSVMHLSIVCILWMSANKFLESAVSNLNALQLFIGQLYLGLPLYCSHSWGVAMFSNVQAKWSCLSCKISPAPSFDPIVLE
jgi:hypothetical protein